MHGIDDINQLVIATGNSGKLKEIKKLLSALPIQILSMQDFPNLKMAEEDGKTYKENAFKKAALIAKQTGVLTLADDSGLEIEALDNRPGLYSARYAGPDCSSEDNIQKVLQELETVAVEKRAARFVCVLALVSPDGKAQYFEGEVLGRITKQKIGVQGFGYDPIFYVEEFQKTMAELKPEEKNRISHRAKALNQLKTHLSSN